METSLCTLKMNENFEEKKYKKNETLKENKIAL
jgi:hypothetical protein